MAGPIVQDVIAYDRASKTYNNISTSVNKLARDTNRANATTARSTSRLAAVHKQATAQIKASTVGAGLAGALLVKGIIRGTEAVVQAATDQKKANAQTAAVIKSTGGAAHVTAKQIGELSGAISRQTGIMDDTVQASANMLLTFKNIRNEVGRGNDIFNQATKTVTDMSVALGQDGVKSAIQLGKALNDPIKGLTALQRVGVQFTDAQKKQIKTLVEHGKTLEAQKLILQELNSEFGGSAKAQATAGGKMSAAWDNLKETIGNKLQPKLDTLANWFTNAATWMTKHATLTQNLVVVTLALAAAFTTLAVANAAANAVAQANPYVRLATGIALVAGALIYAYKQSASFRMIVHQMVDNIVADFRFLVRAVYNVLVYPFLTALSAILHGAAIAFGWIPGLNDKLRHARDAFDRFKNEVNRIVQNIIQPPPPRLSTKEFAADVARYKSLWNTITGLSGVNYVTTVFTQKGSPFARASGGPVAPGTAYTVGERGPELFMPSVPGTIIPNHQTRNVGAGGGITINEVHVHGVQSTSQLWQELQKYAKRNGSIKLSGVTP